MAWCKRFMPIVVLIIVSLFIGGVTIYAAGGDPSSWPIVYQDNFENPSSGWDVEKSADVTTAYVDGAYEIQVQTGGFIAWSFLPTNKDYLDFSAQVEAESLGNDGEFGFLFRYVDSDNFYCFTICNDGTYCLWMQKAGAWQTWIDWTSIPGFAPAKVHILKVQAQGNEFTFNLDGVVFFKFTDGTFRAGELALAVDTFDGPNFSVRFDNLVVREDPEIRKLADQAQALFDQADAAYSAWQLEEAKEKFQEAADIYRKLNWKSKQANVELHLGDSFSHLGSYQGAVKHYEAALSIYHAIGDQDGQAINLMLLGNCYEVLSDYKTAIHYQEQALSIYRAIDDQDGQAINLTGLGKCYYALGDYKQAIDYYEKSLEIYRAIDDRQGEAMNLTGLGSCYFALGNFRKAIDHYEQAIAILRTIGDRDGEANSLISLGDSYFFALGNFKKTIDYHEQALLIFRAIGDRDGEATSLIRLGGDYYELGDHKKVINYYKQALLIFRAIGDRDGEATSLWNLANCYEDLGDYKTAIDYHEQELGIFREIGNRQGEKEILNDLGNCYRSLGDHQQAIAYYEKSLTIDCEIGNRYEARSLEGLGLCHEGLKDYRKAIDYHKRALSIDLLMEDMAGEVDDLGNLGNCYDALGDYKTAIHYYESCLATAKMAIITATGLNSSPTVLWMWYDRLGSLYRSLHAPTQAVGAWKQAVEVIEGMRGELERARSKSSFMKGKLFVYGKLVPMLVEVGNSKDAVSYAERAKARTLEDMVETAMREGTPLPGALQAASEPLKELVSTQQAAAGPLSRAARERTGLQRAAQMAEKDYETILDKLEQTYPELGETLSVKPKVILDHFDYVQANLGKGTVALEYFVTDDETVAWVITHDGIQTASRILISRNALTAKVRAFRERIQEPPKQVVDLEALKKARDLYDILISPVEDYIQTASHLVIVPSDVLFYLPFGALYRCPGCEGEDLLGGKFLIENYSISYAPSLSSLYWPFQHARGDSYGSILAVGNPTGDLTSAEQEARAAASLFQQSTVLIRAQATEAAVKGALQTASYDVIHLATHGLFDTKMPLLSELVFRDGGNDDGNLYAGEILGLPLKTNLVVLSACQTALPPELTQETEGLVVGDELQGLSQALFVAGAPTAVLTLWNVNDVSTSRLMQAMYKGLKGGDSKGEALRQAQLSLLHDPTYRHPYYWAPFVLYGNWR